MLSVAPNTTDSNQTQLSVLNVAPSGMVVKYTTFANNLPNTYGNYLAVWQASQIPWKTPPLTQVPIPSDSNTGSMALPFMVQAKGYIVGYSVGKDAPGICSTVYVPAGGTPNQPFLGSVSVQDVTSDVLTIAYDMPAGCNPQAFKHKIGIWQSNEVPYDGSKPFLSPVAVTSTSDSDTILLPVSLRIKTQYTLGYFAGPESRNLSCTFTFTTGA